MLIRGSGLGEHLIVLVRTADMTISQQKEVGSYFSNQISNHARCTVITPACGHCNVVQPAEENSRGIFFNGASCEKGGAEPTARKAGEIGRAKGGTKYVGVN